jgi:hypothetical protein
MQAASPKAISASSLKFKPPWTNRPALVLCFRSCCMDHGRDAGDRRWSSLNPRPHRVGFQQGCVSLAVCERAVLRGGDGSHLRCLSRVFWKAPKVSCDRYTAAHRGTRSMDPPGRGTGAPSPVKSGADESDHEPPKSPAVLTKSLYRGQDAAHVA